MLLTHSECVFQMLRVTVLYPVVRQKIELPVSPYLLFTPVSLSLLKSSVAPLACCGVKSQPWTVITWYPPRIPIIGEGLWRQCVICICIVLLCIAEWWISKSRLYGFCFLRKSSEKTQLLFFTCSVVTLFWLVFAARLQHVQIVHADPLQVLHCVLWHSLLLNRFLGS